jgi:hypothetical protein
MRCVKTQFAIVVLLPGLHHPARLSSAGHGLGSAIHQDRTGGRAHEARIRAFLFGIFVISISCSAAYCNGSTLLKGFDIFRAAGSGPLVKSFQHVEPTPEGQIEISFIPAVNYPSVSAIEVIPE